MFCVVTLFSFANTARAQDDMHNKMDAQSQHVFFTPDSLKWVDAPPSLPAGAKMVVLQGDPTKEGMFTLLFKVPDGFKIPPHTHPADEHVTVLSGMFFMGTGSKFDTSKGKELPAGSFVLMPKGMQHFAWVKGETIIQLHGIGPWGINYVNPDDDPRNKPMPKGAEEK